MTASGFTMRRYWIALIILVGMTVIPFIVAFAANWLLQINNCAFDLKGGTHCLIGGSDWGLPSALFICGPARWLQRFCGHRWPDLPFGLCCLSKV
jgi:hypothetical protein